MGGVGPPPKDHASRARRNKDAQPQTLLRFEKAEPLNLPTFEVEVDGKLVAWEWPARTQEWWDTWTRSPQAEHFGSTDWQFLLDTALIHAQFWQGDLQLAGELRLRVAKFGATMEDRARLRMQFAAADEADRGRPEPSRSAARERYGKLRVMRPEADEDGDVDGGAAQGA